MITLYTYPSGFGLFSLSPFCVKAAWMLDYSGLPWQREDHADPRKMPHGKLPAIRTATGEIIGDTDAIRRHLESCGVDFEPGLTETQKSVGRALIRMAEEHLYFHVLLDRWGRDDVWPVIRKTYFASVPKLMRNSVANGLRRRVIKGMEVQGLARFSEEERLARTEQDLTAISNLLWQGPFLLGRQMSLADFSMAAMLDALRSTPGATPVSRRVSEDKMFSDYIARVMTAVHAGPKQPASRSA